MRTFFNGRNCVFTGAVGAAVSGDIYGAGAGMAKGQIKSIRNYIRFIHSVQLKHESMLSKCITCWGG